MLYLKDVSPPQYSRRLTCKTRTLTLKQMLTFQHDFSDLLLLGSLSKCGAKFNLAVSWLTITSMTCNSFLIWPICYLRRPGDFHLWRLGAPDRSLYMDSTYTSMIYSFCIGEQIFTHRCKYACHTFIDSKWIAYIFFVLWMVATNVFVGFERPYHSIANSFLTCMASTKCPLIHPTISTLSNWQVYLILQGTVTRSSWVSR